MPHDQPLVGRDRELAELARHLARPSGACAMIVGEAGIGKSALVRAAAPNGVAGAATEPPAPALRPLVEIALGAIRGGADPEDAALRVHRRALAALLPGLVDARDGSTDGSAAVHPIVLADALCRLLDTRSDRPVLIIDDLHWADPVTLATVEALAERAVADGRHLLLALRPEGEPWRRVLRLAERRIAGLVELGPLAADAVAALLATRLGTAVMEVPPELLAAVAPAEGRPLWVEEILATATAGAGVPPAPIVPRTLGTAVARRVEGLGTARTVLECASVAGREVDAGLVAGALGRSPADVADALRAGLDAGLLARTADGQVRFRHELLRTAVLDGVLADQRRAHAGGLLAALDTAGRPRPELAAALALAAGRDDRAAASLIEVAERDLDRGLPETAAHALDRALALAPAPELDAHARELRVHACALAGDVDAALADSVPVDAQLARRPDAAGRRRRLGEAVVRATAGRGRWEEAERLLADLQARFPAAASTAALAALVHLERGRFADARGCATAALDAPGAEPAARCEAMEVLGRLGRRADLAEAEHWFRRAVVTAEQHGLALWRARALHELATVTQLRDLDVEALYTARAAAVDSAAPGTLAAVEQHLAAVHGVRFDAEPALRFARSTLDTARRLGARSQAAFAWILIGQAHVVAGRREQADLAAAEALALGEGDREIAGLAWATCRGLAALLADEVDIAVAHWRRGIEAMRELGVVTPLPPWYLWGLLATALDLEGDGGERARAETASAELRVATGPDALWHLAEAVARGRAGDRDGAAAAARTAEKLFARVPGFAGFRSLGLRLATPAALADGWGEPARWSVEVERWAGERGFAGLARAARSLAGQAGVRRRRAGRGDSVVPAHLVELGVTSREMDVLALVVDGLTNKEIAARLYITPRTVKGHIELLLAKTGAVNRIQLARRHGPSTTDR